MKKTISAIAIATVLIITCTIPADAQTRVLGTADIPFSFYAHDQRFDAGAYELRQLGSNTIRLQRRDTGQGVTLLSPQTIVMSDSTTLVFKATDSRSTLVAVNAAAYQIAVRMSDRERETYASAPRVISIAVRLPH